MTRGPEANKPLGVLARGALLPVIDDEAAWAEARLPPRMFAAALAVVAARHGLVFEAVSRARHGSSPVFLSRRWAVKWVPPFWRREAEVEARCLSHIEGALALETPALEAFGALDGWTYLVTSRVEGVPLRSVFPTLTVRDQVGVAGACGALLARLHALPLAGLGDAGEGWAAYVAHRLAEGPRTQRAAGLSEHLLRRLPGWLDPLSGGASRSGLSLLHGDLHHEHLVLRAEGGRWVLKGLLDLGDALVGEAAYDLVTPAFYVACGRREAQRALFDAAGFRCDAAASARMMAWSVMHRYLGLAHFLPPNPGPLSLEVLQARYWPVLC